MTTTAPHSTLKRSKPVARLAAGLPTVMSMARLAAGLPIAITMARFAARLPIAIFLAAVAGCGANGDRTIDPTATYEVYGERFETGAAVPAQAVTAEPAMYVGRNVVVEGLAADTCADAACWMTMDAGNGRAIEVYLPPDKEDALEIPSDVAGRRIVVAGKLTSPGPRIPTEDANELTTLGNQYPPTNDTLQTQTDSTLRLTATGILVEKVRS